MGYLTEALNYIHICVFCAMSREVIQGPNMVSLHMSDQDVDIFCTLEILHNEIVSRWPTPNDNAYGESPLNKNRIGRE
jgi:hypothetical protein